MSLSTCQGSAWSTRQSLSVEAIRSVPSGDWHRALESGVPRLESQAAMLFRITLNTWNVPTIQVAEEPLALASVLHIRLRNRRGSSSESMSLGVAFCS